MSGPIAAGLLYWYTTSTILGLLTILNIASVLLARLATRRVPLPRPSSPSNPLAPSARRVSTGSTDDTDHDVEKDLSILEGGGDSERASGRGWRLIRATGTVWTKHVVLADLPVPGIKLVKRKARTIATTDVGWSIAYTVGVLVLSLHGTEWDTEALSIQTGWMAIAQIPLIIALAGKNNFISLLTGLSYEKLNFLHRAAGRVCLLCSWLHVVGYLFLLGGVSLVQFKTSLTTWGMTSILALSLMYIVSMRWVRRRIYEFFLVAHICFAALFLAGVIMHWSAVDIWIYPGIALWAADRLLRIARLFLPTLSLFSASTPLASTGTITLLTPSTIKLTLPTRTTWKAGQHFYVLLPTLSRLPWETHPFTAAGIPGDGEVSFVIRVRDGMTGRMKAAVKEGNTGSVQGRVEGPYGGSGCLRGVDGVVIFAGGSGISFAVAHLLQIAADAKAGKTACRHANVIWMVKSKHLPSSLTITLHVHVTKRAAPSLSTQSALPTDPSTTDGDWQTYLEERAARPRQRSRMMSTMSWATFGEGGGLSTTGTGAGTRRGSEATTAARRSGSIPREERRSDSIHSAGSAKLGPGLYYGRKSEGGDEESPKGFGAGYETSAGLAPGIVLPTFTWSEGYAGSKLPTMPTLPAAYGGFAAHRKASGPFSPLNPARSSLYDAAGPSSPSSSSPISPRRQPTSFDPSNYDEESSYTRTPSRTRRVSFADTGLSPQRARFSADQGVLTERRVSAASSESSFGHKASPLTSPARKKSSLVITSTYPFNDDAFSEKILDIPFLPTSPTSPTELNVSLGQSGPLNFSRPLPSTLQIPPMAAQMSRSSTAESVASHFSLLPLPSGLVTPSTPLPPLPMDFRHPLQREQKLQDDPIRLSPGLEYFVRWHEGRADPAAIIRQMKDLLERGRMEVMVCGPASLLGAVKKATRDEMRVGEVYRGGVKVGFHAESFGW